MRPESPGRPKPYFSRIERDREIYLLLPKAKLGDPKAIQRIMELYYSVVQGVVKQAVSFQPAPSSLVSYEDLLQDGLEGLLHAIKDFDLSNGSEFGQYCWGRIRYWVLDQIEEKARSIRLPRSVLKARRALERARRELESQGNCNPSLEELAHQAGLGLAQAKTALEAPLVQSSLNRQVEVGETTRELGEIWEEQAARDPRNGSEEAVDPIEIKTSQLQAAVNSLSERERFVLFRRFFTDPPWSQSKIAEVLEVSHSRVSQIETSALAKTREALEHPDSKKSGRQEPTARQTEVLGLLQEGLSSREIATRLGITCETVASHAKRIYRKEGVSGRRELISQARKQGLPSGDALREILECLNLSPREADVAEMLLEGESIKAIAEKLMVSSHTVQSHILAIYRKLDIHHRKQLFDLVEEEYRRHISTVAG